jgi:hypothetical protein
MARGTSRSVEDDVAALAEPGARYRGATNREPPMASSTTRAPSVARMVRVAPSQATAAPRASNMARSGTSVRPLTMRGGTSKVSQRPCHYL